MTSGRRWSLAGGIFIVAIVAVLASILILDPPPEQVKTVSEEFSTGPGPGRVTMIDLGATACVPCKMMAPIIEELKEEYKGKADIIFIDVWEDPTQARKYGIQAIPTQIFFDRDGKEVRRHVGFMGKDQIVEIFSKLGVS